MKLIARSEIGSHRRGPNTLRSAYRHRRISARATTSGTAMEKNSGGCQARKTARASEQQQQRRQRKDHAVDAARADTGKARFRAAAQAHPAIDPPGHTETGQDAGKIDQTGRRPERFLDPIEFERCHHGGQFSRPPRRPPAGRSVHALQYRREEAVAAVPVRVEAQRARAIERDAGAREFRCRVAQREFRVLGQEIVDDRLVLGGQHAACGVDQAPAGLDQRRGGGEQTRLLRGECGRSRRASAAT